MQIFLNLTLYYFLLGCSIGVNFVYLTRKIYGLKNRVLYLEKKIDELEFSMKFNNIYCEEYFKKVNEIVNKFTSKGLPVKKVK